MLESFRFKTRIKFTKLKLRKLNDKTEKLQEQKLRFAFISPSNYIKLASTHNHNNFLMFS